MSIRVQMVLTAAVLAASGLLPPAPAAARLPSPDRTFLAEETAAFRTLTDTLLTRTGSPTATLNGVRELLAARERAVRRLEEILPITGLDGIETLDLLDDVVVHDLNTLVQTEAIDTTGVSEEDAFLYAEAMVGIPPLGQAPVGFMVIAFTQIAVAAADSVEAAAHLGENRVSHLALNAIRHATDLYVSLDEDLVSQDRKATFRESSVLFRLRCPQDGAGYALARERNRVLSDRSLARVSILVCTACGDTLEATFPLVLPTALHQRTEEQNLDEAPRGARPGGGVEP